MSSMKRFVRLPLAASLRVRSWLISRLHLKECSQCRSDYKELSNLVTRELPQTQGTLREKLAAHEN